jgi:hypothetical protein
LARSPFPIQVWRTEAIVRHGMLNFVYSRDTWKLGKLSQVKLQDAVGWSSAIQRMNWLKYIYIHTHTHTRANTHTHNIYIHLKLMNQISYFFSTKFSALHFELYASFFQIILVCYCFYSGIVLALFNIFSKRKHVGSTEI